MFLTLALALAAPPGCTDTKRECNACTTTDGKQRCSNPGIACQPLIRMCRAKDDMVVADKAKFSTPKHR